LRSAFSRRTRSAFPSLDTTAFSPQKSSISAVENGDWVAAYRKKGTSLYKVEPNRDYKLLSETPGLTARHHEAGQFVIQLGLAAWPEWAPVYRSYYTPTFFIPFYEVLPEA